MALAASALATSAAIASPAKARLIIALKDPGCHWFYTGGGPNNRHYSKSLTRVGPVTLLNLDEAALNIKGPWTSRAPGDTKIKKISVKLTLKVKGTYRITMVKQAPDDNHLVLRIT